MSSRREAGPPPAGQVRDDYLGALLEGDVHGARSVVQAALDAGMRMSDLYLRVFQEALHEVGRCWQTGEASVAQEHLATATTQALMATIGGDTIFGPRDGRLAIATATQGDFHGLAPRFLADFLERDGWRVIELGGGTPTASLVEMVEQLEPALVCLSTTLPVHVPRALEAIRALRALEPAPLIAAGGQGYGGEDRRALQAGADLFAADAASFLRQLNARLPEALRR